MSDPARFSTLQRVEIAEIATSSRSRAAISGFSTLQRVEIAEISHYEPQPHPRRAVSVLFNESKLPKCIRKICEVRGSSPFQYSSTSRNCRNRGQSGICGRSESGFSTLQRVEIAEIGTHVLDEYQIQCFSTLQRVEIAEIEEGFCGA